MMVRNRCRGLAGFINGGLHGRARASLRGGCRQALVLYALPAWEGNAQRKQNMSKILATMRQRVLYEAREIWCNGFVTFDTETTGLEWEDQIIQWAVCRRRPGQSRRLFITMVINSSAGK